MSTATKKAKTSARKPIPWPKIEVSFEAGLSMEKIAHKHGYYKADAADPLKETRGICSRGRNPGYKGADGKIHKFDQKARDKAIEAAGGKPYGSKPKQVKAKTVKAKVAKVKVAKLPKQKTVKATKGILIVAESGGGFVRLTIGKQEGLLATADFLKTVTPVVNGLGFKLEKLELVDETPNVELIPVPEAGGETVAEPEPVKPVVPTTPEPAPTTTDVETEQPVVTDEIPEPVVQG